MKKPFSILLIDDSEIDNILNEMIIKNSCLQDSTIRILSSIPALQLLGNENTTTDHIPDIIFLDIKMPINDGFEFLEKFEKLPEELTKKTQIIILTSSLDEEETERIKKNRFVKMILSKPLSLEALE